MFRLLPGIQIYCINLYKVMHIVAKKQTLQQFSVYTNGVWTVSNKLGMRSWECDGLCTENVSSISRDNEEGKFHARNHKEKDQDWEC